MMEEAVGLKLVCLLADDAEMEFEGKESTGETSAKTPDSLLDMGNVFDMVGI